MYSFTNIDNCIEQQLPSCYDQIANCDPEFDELYDDLAHVFAVIRPREQD